jgi:Amt family ammonium transporter
MAKDRGRGSVQVYQRDDADVAQRRDEMSWVGRISQELNSGKSRLYGQQIVALSQRASGGLSFEVLLRLGADGGRVQPPGDLIRAAERFGLMNTVDRWVIRNALRTLRSFSDEALRRTSRCFINLSGLSLRDASVLDFIRSQLAETGIPPHKLCFEITETAAVENLEQARWLIQELGSIGCKLALDDFGTGAASYGYLRDLPVHYLKIDGSFVEAMPTTALDRALVESINQISHLLGMETVAESVSDFETLGRLRDIGVDYVQGFWISRPQPVENLARVATEGPTT